MVVFIMGIVLLVSGRDILVLVLRDAFVVLRWFNVSSLTFYFDHGFSSSSHKQRQILLSKWIRIS